jgi:hypothetical protein
MTLVLVIFLLKYRIHTVHIWLWPTYSFVVYVWFCLTLLVACT